MFWGADDVRWLVHSNDVSILINHFDWLRITHQWHCLLSHSECLLHSAWALHISIINQAWHGTSAGIKRLLRYLQQRSSKVHSNRYETSRNKQLLGGRDNTTKEAASCIQAVLKQLSGNTDRAFAACSKMQLHTASGPASLCNLTCPGSVQYSTVVCVGRHSLSTSKFTLMTTHKHSRVYSKMPSYYFSSLQNACSTAKACTVQ